MGSLSIYTQNSYDTDQVMALLRVGDCVFLCYDSLFPIVAWAIPPSLRQHEEDSFFVIHGHCHHILVSGWYQSLRPWENRFPGIHILNCFVSIPCSITNFRCTLPKVSRTQLIVVEYGQNWNREANRVDGWDQDGANRRTEIFRAVLVGTDLKHFHAGLASESVEPQIEALGRYLKAENILTAQIFGEIGWFGDPDERGKIDLDWNSLHRGRSGSYKQDGFEFYAPF